MISDEFELIRHYFSELGRDRSGSVCLGVGDDCAIITPPSGKQLVVSIDTLVEGTHFLPGTSGDKVASRLLGAALSDLAAMGARPAFFTLALTLPQADEPWLQAFSIRLAELAKQHGVALVGGDTTKGPLTLSVQVHGWVAKGKALRRSGASPGDQYPFQSYYQTVAESQIHIIPSSLALDQDCLQWEINQHQNNFRDINF